MRLGRCLSALRSRFGAAARSGPGSRRGARARPLPGCRFGCRLGRAPPGLGGRFGSRFGVRPRSRPGSRAGARPRFLGGSVSGASCRPAGGAMENLDGLQLPGARRLQLAVGVIDYLGVLFRSLRVIMNVRMPLLDEQSVGSLDNLSRDSDFEAQNPVAFDQFPITFGHLRCWSLSRKNRFPGCPRNGSLGIGCQRFYRCHATTLVSKQSLLSTQLRLFDALFGGEIARSNPGFRILG